MKVFKHLIVAVMVCLALSTSGFSGETDLVSTPNFLALGPEEDNFTKHVVDLCEKYRQQISKDWFGEELPPSVGRSTVHIEVGESNSSLTWPIDHASRKMHSVYLRGMTQDIIISGAIPHEIAHTVIFTWRPLKAKKHSFPLWINEGIACYYEAPQFFDQRQRTINWMIKTGNLSAFNKVFKMSRMGRLDFKEYAIASSVVEFLVKQKGKQAVIKFGDLCQNQSMDIALWEVYRISDIKDLRQRWIRWVSSR